MNTISNFAESAFKLVAQTTWQATVVAGLILVAQWLFRKRLTPAWRYGLWFLLVARLLMPASFPSALSIFNLATVEAPPPDRDLAQPTSPVPTLSYPLATGTGQTRYPPCQLILKTPSNGRLSVTTRSRHLKLRFTNLRVARPIGWALRFSSGFSACSFLACA